MTDRWGLRIAIALAVYAALVLFGSVARAQTPPELPELELRPCPGAQGIRAAGEEGEGVIVPSETARCLLGRVQTLEEAVPYVRLLEERLRLSDERHALQQRATALAVEQAETADGALEAALRRAREAEESEGAWYRHSALWFTAGVLVTVVLEIVAVIAFAEVVR